jgi:hypothetical protein
MTSLVYQAGNRIHVQDGTYTLPDEAEARRLLLQFMAAGKATDEIDRSFKRYNAHLEALLSGGSFEAEGGTELGIDPNVFEVPKPKK